MKDKIFGVLQRVGRSFMLPIAILPVAGLLLGIGSSFTNETTIAMYGLEGILGTGTILNGLLVIMNKVGSIVFDNLPLIFAVGVAIGMAKKEKEVSALSAVIAYFVMNTAINAMLVINGELSKTGEIAADVLDGTIASSCGIQTLQMGVFGGIIVGLGVAALHNRFYKITLPNALSFFGGTRFVPIISTIVYMFVGIALYFIWPTVQNGIYALGGLVTGSGYAGTLIFGLIKRALIPFGLHHVFYMPFWQTAVGGTMEVAGQMVQGGQNIFFAQLADSANVAHFSADATRYFSGEFIFMIFGLPGAALAMFRCAKPEKRRAAGGLLLSAALACMMTGITEPIEFSFLFVAPALFAVQVVLAGSAYMIAHMLNIAVGLTFSGGLLDFFLFGILQGNEKTSWIRVIPVGIIYFFLYYFIFTFLIKRFNLKTPGREDDDAETKLYTKADVNARRENKNSSDGEVQNEDALSLTITKGLGGKKNISDVDCCATRLRCTVLDPDKVNDALLKSTGASGVVHKGSGVQIIYGPHVTVIKSNLEDYLESAPDEVYEDSSDGEDAAERGTSCESNKKGSNEKENNAENADKGAEPARTVIISSPVKGIAADLSTAPDEAFAGRMMGDGAVVTPTEPIVSAPEDGEVCFVFETKHAIGFMTDTGVSLLIHIGIDTVKLNGKGFEALVENGQKVRKGEPMLKLDLDYLKENAPSVVSPVLCTELEDNQKVRLLKSGAIDEGEALFAIDIFE
ncbi:PTS glucose transporter subunit IIABC [Faecalicatena orotica]|uniref:PTS system IIA component (Glc family) /PTS system IIB component (Glc family) /PTS system IIC component (Glc family) n=1 Tax=Faecalicatena orotica TaxID=1544 RepID=A0A2Y9BGA0_9FIRM|nr:PTS transporter subunit IIABC [Faecalicatena orotica]PWJ28696.1 PTS system IIA component (Glc family) /PTS system IIB component (Glc family) /PTS system IIC component (Glc family) [Faecalicatena orotica]SSA56518.1 PTS system IIA component, Glc family /PTS system IIB component, Glc family /PTS system IIC component, Glc family [Faecalicatena orotica]